MKDSAWINWEDISNCRWFSKWHCSHDIKLWSIIRMPFLVSFRFPAHQNQIHLFHLSLNILRYIIWNHSWHKIIFLFPYLRMYSGTFSLLGERVFLVLSIGRRSYKRVNLIFVHEKEKEFEKRDIDIWPEFNI